VPKEEELVKRYAVSRTTVRQTIQNFIRRGLIEIRRSKGTFVLQPKITQELTHLSGFVENMQSLGRNASARLLDKQTVPASESAARQLAIKTGTPVVRIQRVRLADNSPSSFDETYYCGRSAKEYLRTIWKLNRSSRCSSRSTIRLCWQPSTVSKPYWPI
jgi:GntR family transcriptional regulator